MAALLRALLDRSAGCPRPAAARGRRPPGRDPAPDARAPDAPSPDTYDPQTPQRRQAMNAVASPDTYGVLTEPTTLTIQRLLPGPIERVWAYLTESDLRRQWLAAGQMEMKVGAPFELIWRNSELTNPPGRRPDGFGDEHRMESRITELDPPRRLAFTRGKGSGDVSFELEPRGGGGRL